MRFLVAAGLAALTMLAALGTARGSETVPVRDCRSRGDPGNGVPSRFASRNDIVVGPVSFAGARLFASAIRIERGEDGRFATKLASKVLWGRPVTIAVAERHRAALALDYARPPGLTSAVRLEPCPPGTPMFGGNGRLRRVTVFPGGVSMTRRGCYELEVRVERGRTYRRTISLGGGDCR